MASYIVNKAAVAKARSLIRGRQYVLDSDWGDVQPKANDEKAFLASHSWSEYAEWHLGLTEGAVDETKARYAFVYGEPPPATPLRADRLPLSSRGVAAQGDRTGSAQLLQLLDKAAA